MTIDDLNKKRDEFVKRRDEAAHLIDKISHEAIELSGAIKFIDELLQAEKPKE